METKPKVSVIIPVYNAEMYLRQCLDSVCEQTLSDIEIICVDDGSTDNSLEILYQYREKDPRVIVLEQENVNAGAARNLGLKHASGEYLAFLDSDDFFDRNMLARAVTCSEEQNCEIVAFDVSLFDDENKVFTDDTWVVKKSKLPKINPFSYKDCTQYLFNCLHTCAWNKLFRTSLVKKYGLYFQSLKNTNDLYFVCMALSLAERIYYLPERLMTYRVNIKTSLSQGKSRSKNPDDAHTAFKFLREGLQKYDRFDTLKQSYDNLCLGVYYYNLQHMNGNDYVSYVSKLSFDWLPELHLSNQNENYFYYPHLYKFQKAYSNIQLYSFDIFDTLITRKTILATGAFSIMQQELNLNAEYQHIPKSLRCNFYEIRTQTERFMYQKMCSNERRDITIDDIYALIANNYSVLEEDLKKLKALEILIEKRNIVPIHANIDLVETLVKKGAKVILITDMYLSAEAIRSFLIPFSNIFKSIPIFVSCECQAKKYHGEMYSFVHRKLGIPFSSWIHLGDNIHSDVEQCKKFGIKAHQCFFPKNKEYECFILRTRLKNPDIQIYLGAARNLCLSNNLSELGEFGIRFGGPFLFLYVLWVVEQAAYKGIEALYFVARDGFITKSIAEIIIAEKKMNITTHYIYGSRISWRDVYEKEDKEKIRFVAKYLAQEIDFSKKIAFVEYAGTGRTMDCVAHIIHDYNLGNIVGTFYLYLSKNPYSSLNQKFSFIELNERFGTIIELLVRAPHGQTLGYAVDNNKKIIPILEENEGSALLNYGYMDYIQGVLMFAKKAVKDNLAYVQMDILLDYMKYIQSKEIDIKTADLLGGIPFVLDGLVKHVAPYAPQLTFSDLQYYPNQIEKIHTLNLNISEKRSSLSIQKEINKIRLGTATQESSDTAKLKGELSYYKHEYYAIQSSFSFRIGKAVTFFPRKIRGGIRCFRENGFKYTLKRILEKLHYE